MHRGYSLIVAFLLTTVVCMPALGAENAPLPNRTGIASPSAQQADGCGGGCGATPAGGVAADVDLKLTDAQKKKIAAIDAKYTAATKSLKEKYRSRSEALTKVVSNPKSSEGDIRKAVRALTDIQAELYIAKTMQKRETDKVYTPAQREILAKLGACGCGSNGSSSNSAGGNAPSGGCGGGCGGG